MRDEDRLARLQQVAAMKRDHDMARLHRLASHCEGTREKIAQLSHPQPLVSDPALFAVRQAHLAWAGTQRMHLNVTLANQTARMLEQRGKTAQSFGRADALERLARKIAKQRPLSR
ncbi:MAG: hypothetical protein EA339_14385 [Rhodobacteraceae bacterium]|nr:MAG: hypothetical protein EA339_14385 [Paracoccaceae bacterium]